MDLSSIRKPGIADFTGTGLLRIIQRINRDGFHGFQPVKSAKFVTCFTNVGIGVGYHYRKYSAVRVSFYYFLLGLYNMTPLLFR